jgi:hypothetical protein
VCHLQAGPFEAALDVETFIGVAAVENALVAADLFGNVIESLDESEAELLALLVLGDGDVFDVTDGPEAVDAIGKVNLLIFKPLRPKSSGATVVAKGFEGP